MSKDCMRLKKRLMLNLDGTGQAEYTGEASTVDGKKTSPPRSNVSRIGRATLLEDDTSDFEQIVYYQAGVAAVAENSRLQTFTESAWGTGVLSNVREAYGFICNNYDYGDEIYITGFSRGAFTARSVAGLIGKCGILTKVGMDQFYEALDYYQNSYDKLKAGPCPVSEEDGTTRKYYPNTNPPKSQPIRIKAVGVWDTVGALGSNWRFHELGLGDHVENAYHIMALDEHRGAFDVTMWEWENPNKKSPDKARPLHNFEQCWMAGDHSNVGGSWPEQQLSDISLAWMMSRFGVLGVKFDQNYLYREFLKLKKYVKVNGPNLKGNDGPSYPADLSPRQWGEGRIHDLNKESLQAWAVMGSRIDRKVGLYCKPVWKHAWLWGDYVEEGAFLRNTNETFHPVVRYRQFCKRQGKLSYRDNGSYDPGSMKEWAWPRTQTDGRVGDASAIRSRDSLEWSRQRKEDDKMIELKYKESPMGEYEKMYLAFYDQDKELRDRDGSIWKQVLGGDGPPRDIKDKVAQIKRAVNPSDY